VKRLPAYAWVLLLAAPALAGEGDWPQFLGPSRNLVVPGEDLAAKWPAAGPAVVWKMPVGQGFSGPVVSGGKLILFHRVGDEEVVECLAAETGKPVWTSKYSTAYRDDFGFDEGPRSTPAIDGGHAFTFGAEGKLHCWDLQSGKYVWSVDTREKFRQDKGFFGIACSPLVEGDAVVLNVGGRDGAGVVAFDCGSGKVRWKATNDEAGYASPVAATLSGRRYVLSFNRAGLVALDPKDGAVRFTFPWRSRSHASVNAATPVVVGDSVFLSASYGTGAVLLKIAADAKPQAGWSGDESLSNHYATSVHYDGFLYGFDGRQEERPRLRCVELNTGKVRWSEDAFGAGTLLAAGDKLLILKESGELVMAAASPEKFAPLAQAKILDGECRAYPALAHGLFYARDKGTLVCVDLRDGGAGVPSRRR
jgi:outer membrane protein assembly factor BamB